jgi:hypothetical protein
MRTTAVQNILGTFINRLIEADLGYFFENFDKSKNNPTQLIF